MTKYRENMSPEEKAALLEECRAIEEAYAAAAELPALDGGEWDEMGELRKAALDHRGQP